MWKGVRESHSCRILRNRSYSSTLKLQFYCDIDSCKLSILDLHIREDSISYDLSHTAFYGQPNCIVSMNYMTCGLLQKGVTCILLCLIEPYVRTDGGINSALFTKSLVPVLNYTSTQLEMRAYQEWRLQLKMKMCMFLCQHDITCKAFYQLIQGDKLLSCYHFQFEE